METRLFVGNLTPDTVERLRSEGQMRVDEAPGTDFAYVGLHLRDPVLADRRVRQAIGYAIDRDAIVRYLRRGLAQPAVGVVPPLSWAYAADAFQFTCDPARAQALLDAAGFRDPDGPGPTMRLRLTLKVSTNEFYRLQATVIQQDLRKVGIDLDVRSYEFATLSKDVASGNFQLVTLQWVGISDPDMLRRVFHSKQVPPVGFNRGFYSNPDVDRVIDAATEATDDETRARLYREAQQRIAEDAPYISLWYKTNVAVARADLTGIRLTPLAEFTFLKDVSRTGLSAPSTSLPPFSSPSRQPLRFTARCLKSIRSPTSRSAAGCVAVHVPFPLFRTPNGRRPYRPRRVYRPRPRAGSCARTTWRLKFG
jgi:peptide/nickel transport system substrate-binding protein